jgi:hypothetical protein
MIKQKQLGFGDIQAGRIKMWSYKLDAKFCGTNRGGIKTNLHYFFNGKIILHCVTDNQPGKTVSSAAK